MRGETGNEASLHMVATVVLSSSLYDRMKTRLDIELKNTSAVAVATIDMIAQPLNSCSNLKFSANLLNAADLSENLETNCLRASESH